MYFLSPSMIVSANSEYQKLEHALSKIANDSDSVLSQAERSIDATLRSIDLLKSTIQTEKFNNIGEEILFFKQIKPKFTAKLIFNVELFKIEGKRPIGSQKTQQRYIDRQLKKLESFFEDNVEFYQYYRSGNTYHDEKYFVRNVFDIRLHQDAYVFDYDPNFSTSHDFKVGKIIANEMLRQYLNAALLELEQNKFHISKSIESPQQRLVWTGTRAGLVELLFGLHAAGVFNNSNASLAQIARYLETMFGIELGNFHRAFQEIRIRKSGRTNFIDRMKKKLVERMDEADGN